MIKQWEKYDFITAISQGNLFSVESDLLQRLILRLIKGTREICSYLDEARKKR